MQHIILWIWVSLIGVLESLIQQNYVRINHQLDGTRLKVNEVNTLLGCASACDRKACEGFLWNKDADIPCELLTTKDFVWIDTLNGTDTYLPTIYGNQRILCLPQIRDREKGEKLCKSAGGDLPGYPETDEEKNRTLAFGKYFISAMRSGNAFSYPNGTVLDVTNKLMKNADANRYDCLYMVYQGLMDKNCQNNSHIPVEHTLLCVIDV